MSWEHYIQEQQKQVTAEEAVRELIKTLKLQSKSRLREDVYRRQYLMYFLIKKTTIPKTKIGAMFNRDHATTIHAIRRVEDAQYTKDVEFWRIVSEVKEYLDAFDFEDASIYSNGGDGFRKVYSYLPPEVFKDFKDLVSDTEHTLSSYLRELITNHIKQQ